MSKFSKQFFSLLGQGAVPVSVVEHPLISVVCKSLHSIMADLKKFKKKIKYFQSGHDDVKFF